MMQQKDTEELEEALTEVQDVRDYFAANADEFTKRSLAEELARLLTTRHLTKAHVVRDSGLDRTYAYHIFDGTKARPSREKVLALALAMQLTPKETQHLLYYAHQPRLYARSVWDGIIYHALEHGKSVTETNLLIAELHAGPLLR